MARNLSRSVVLLRLCQWFLSATTNRDLNLDHPGLPRKSYDLAALIDRHLGKPQNDEDADWLALLLAQPEKTETTQSHFVIIADRDCVEEDRLTARSFNSSEEAEGFRRGVNHVNDSFIKAVDVIVATTEEEAKALYIVKENITA